MRILFAAVLTALVAALPAAGQEPRRIVVTGAGEVEAVPDLAIVTAGVETQAPLAGDALAENATRMRAVFDALEGLGIAPEDMQTSQLSLNPIWSDRRGGEGPPEITGYEASNLVTVRLRDVGAAGAAIDALASAGANRFAGISFTIAEPAPLREAALADAVTDARAKAERLAESAGVTLGAVTEIRESAGRDGGPIPLQARAETAMDMPIAEGSVGVTARVEIVYAIE